MASIYDIDPQKLIEKVASELKKNSEIVPPEWAPFVKTGVSRQRAPENADWWFIRSAAILRTIYKEGVVGTSKLRSKYGGKQNRGRKPEKFKKSSGNIIRKILQQLEKAGLVMKEEKANSKGRKITPAGQKLLDKIAGELGSSKPAAKKPSKEIIIKKTIKVEHTHTHSEKSKEPNLALKEKKEVSK